MIIENIMSEKNYGVYKYSATNYIYYENKKINNENVYDNNYENEDDEDKNKIQYNISLQNYIIEDENGLPEIISNYYISDPILDKIGIFASIIWNKIDYINDDYDPYNYDPDPKFIIYRCDFDEIITKKYLFIIDELSKEFYSPTTHYKHFNPLLEKIPLDKIKLDNNYEYIIKEINNLITMYNL